MASILKYRTPGSAVQSFKGHFVDFDPQKHFSGFLVSDATGENKFFFEECDGEEACHFSDKNPFCSTKEEYMESARLFLDELRIQSLHKAVFSRIEKKELNRKINESWLFHFFTVLEKSYPNAFVYLFSDEKLGTWIGATPETLLTQEDNQGNTMSLAGTLKKDDAVSWGEKEQIEQSIVTDFIEQTLAAYGIDELAVKGPYTVQAGPVKHLRTDLTFALGTNQVISLAERLHPTPAVSGYPRGKAIDLIRKFEKHERLFYTGFLGVIHPDKSELYVNLRCAQVQEDAVYLYLGGGFTVDSSPLAEWEETVNKSKTLGLILDQL